VALLSSDIVLVTQVAVSGNKRAFDELVRRYQSPVRRFFLSQTMGDEQLSDDLAQDTFIKAYTNIASFRGLASFKTWIMRIAYNVFYDYKRKTYPQSLPEGREMDSVEANYSSPCR
jgi:RNA polymerase sigma-70 factor (ECF subfamily)